MNASILPSGEMVRNVDFTPPVDAIRGQIDRFTRAGDNVAVDARQLSEGLFGDYIPTNMLVLGVAYQAGLLPLTAAAVEEAVRLNGVAVDQNLQAFRYGRLWVADPDRVRALVEPPAPSFEAERAAALARLAGRDASVYVSLLDRCAHLDPEARRLLALRVGELVDYQDARYAAAYVDFVLEVAAREAAIAPGRARRHPRGDPEPLQAHGLQGRVRGRAPPSEARVPRRNARALRRAAPGLLAPPPAAPARARAQAEAPARPVVPAPAPRPPGPPAAPRDALRPLRVRGGAPGGAAPRPVVPWPRDRALAAGGPDAHAAAIELARLPESIRGYEDIKLRSIAKVRGQALTLVSRAATGRST